MAGAISSCGALALMQQQASKGECEAEGTSREKCEVSQGLASASNVADVGCRQIGEIAAQFDAFQKWTAKVASVLNDVQLKQHGLSPLQKQFDRIAGPSTTRRRRTRTHENGSEADRVKARRSPEQRQPIS